MSGWSPATVNRKLSAIASLYEFHQRHGVDLGELLTRWRPGGRAGSWRPFLAHMGEQPSGTERSPCAANVAPRGS